MKKLIACIFTVVTFHFCEAQIPVNNPIDPADTELLRAVDFLSSYYNDFINGVEPDYSKYWTAENCREYNHPDQLVYAINTGVPTYKIGKPTILYAHPEHGYVHIKTLFGWSDSGKVSVMSITNHYIQRDHNNTFHFINPIELNGSDWKTTVVGSITYHYPSYHRFDKKKAKMLADFIAHLQVDWGLQPINIRYYFADSKEELEHLRGFDFAVDMGNRDKPSGMSDDVDNIVYCGGWGENYFHEVVHVYLNRLYPQSPLREGLAVFYGGSLGHDLKWHIKRLNDYLQQHKEISLDKPETFYYLDNYTNPYSTVCGMLCMNAYVKDGMAGVKRMMAYTSMEDIFANEYGVGKAEWDRVLRKMIDGYSR